MENVENFIVYFIENQRMKQITFSFLFLILLFNIVQSKKYLVEVDRKEEDPASLVKEEGNEGNEEDATIESDGKFLNEDF